MGQCIVSRFRAWRTGKPEGGRRANAGDDEHQYHTLPEWCYADAKVTPEMAHIIRESWKHAIDDNRPGWHLEEGAESDILRQEPREDKRITSTLDIPGHVHAATVVASAKECSEKQLMQHHTGSLRSTLGTIREPSVLSGHGALTSQGASSPLGPARANCARFFEVFFGHWFLMEPSIDLIFGDAGTRFNVMIQMINFICQYCDQFESPLVMESIKNVTVAHYKAGIRPRHYDSMAKSLLLTMKKALGLGFTPQVQRAWVSAFSCFFMVSFPMLPVERPVLIQAARTAPMGPAGASATSLDTPTGPPKRFLAF